MTGQRGIRPMQPALPADQYLKSHRLGVVPPHFSRHAAEVFETSNHAFQNGFRTLCRQRYDKRVVRIRPHQNQNRHATAAIGEIDVDLAEIRLHALPRIVGQRYERLTLSLTTLGHVTPHRVVFAPIPFGFQPLEDPHRRVALFRRRLLVCRENLVDQINELAQLRAMLILPLRIRHRLSIALENCSNLPA